MCEDNHETLQDRGSVQRAWQGPSLSPAFRVQGAASLQLRTALIVQGGPGSGKAHTVEVATRALGVHLVPYTCSSLQVYGCTIGGRPMADRVYTTARLHAQLLLV